MIADAKRVLIVGNIPRVCLLIGDELSRCGFDCHSVTDPAEARELLETEGYDLLIADVALPAISGLDLLVFTKQHAPGCKVVLTMGPGNRDHLAQALMLGAYDYVETPFEIGELVETVRRALSGDAEDPWLPIRAATALELGAQVKRAALDSVTTLARAVEAKDPYMRRHSEHVTHYATNLAEALGAPVEMFQSVRVSALLHDIGKIGVPDHILSEPGRPTGDDFEYIRRHPGLGADILSNIALFEPEALMVRHHHENWDGSGYPAGLIGEEIPWVSRVLRVADSMDAMLVGRIYQDAYGVDHLLGELRCDSGRLFDPEVASTAALWCCENTDKLIQPGRPIEALA